MPEAAVEVSLATAVSLPAGGVCVALLPARAYPVATPAPSDRMSIARL
jgi:hypothetical protein